jgi:hypothetical protein
MLNLVKIFGAKLAIFWKKVGYFIKKASALKDYFFSKNKNVFLKVE